MGGQVKRMNRMDRMGIFKFLPPFIIWSLLIQAPALAQESGGPQKDFNFKEELASEIERLQDPKYESSLCAAADPKEIIKGEDQEDQEKQGNCQTDEEKSNRLEFFDRLSESFLSQNQYQFIDSDQFEDLFLEEFEANVKEEYNEKQEEWELRKNRRGDFARAAKEKIIQGLVDGPFGILGRLTAVGTVKAINKIQDLRGKGDKEEGPGEVNRLPLRSLIPTSRYKMMGAKIGHGAGLILFGVGGIALTFWGGPHSSLACSLPGAAFDIGMGFAEHKMGRNLLRKAHFLKILSERRGGGQRNSIKLETAGEIIDANYSNLPPTIIQETLSYGGEASQEMASVTIQTMGTIGSFFQVTKGIKKLVEAFAGTERGFAILKKYEELYQSVLHESLNARQALVNMALREVQNIPGRVKELCQASRWLQKTKVKAEKRFHQRISYLNKKIKDQDKLEKIKLKKGKKHDQNLFQEIGRLESRLADLTKESEELEEIYKGLGGEKNDLKKELKKGRKILKESTRAVSNAQELPHSKTGLAFEEKELMVNQIQCDNTTLLNLIAEKIHQQLPSQEEEMAPALTFQPTPLSYLPSGMIRLRKHKELNKKREREFEEKKAETKNKILTLLDSLEPPERSDFDLSVPSNQ